jgi:NodT family efflux transporter outer membrane factor (OMF) lipoprotein
VSSAVRTSSLKRVAKILAISASTMALLSACEVGPHYERPSAPVTASYKEDLGWKPATPQEAASGGAWWSIYHDPVLDDLEKQVEISNQNLKAAEAGYRAAREEVGVQRGALLPSVGAGASGAQSGGAGNGGTHRQYQASIQGDWQIDLWGRIRRTIETSVFNAQANAADLAAAKLSAQGELAADYFQLRAAEEQKRMLDSSVKAFEESLQIAKNRYDVGVAAMSDVLTAQTELGSAQSQSISIQLTRAQLEHAIAVLVGKPPADFALEPAPIAKTVPVMPAGLPSALLERRPDIASAERKMGAANAQIGVAISAWFPDLTLSGSYGFAATALATLVKASNALWSFGPQIAETIFNGGTRIAQVGQARANYDQAVANYRQTVLTAFQQVEDQLSALRILEQQSKVQDQTVKDAREAEQIALNQYKAGLVDYTTVVNAQTTRLNAETTALNVMSQRLTASVNLVVALGGGWDKSQLPETGFFYSLPDAPKPDKTKANTNTKP